MAQRKPVIIDGTWEEVPAAATLADVVKPGVQSVVTRSGQLVPREAFRRTPVPDGFETNLSDIDKGGLIGSVLGRPSSRRSALLAWEANNVQAFLDEFEEPSNGEARCAEVNGSGEYMTVRNLPLPDRYRPDFIDAMLILDDYPARPPAGIYLLNNYNEGVISQIRGRFNAFRDSAAHDAPPIEGYTWVCYHFRNNAWQFRTQDPARGDNVRKFLAAFLAELDC